MRERYEAFEHDNPDEARKLRLRIAQTGSWSTLSTVLSRLEAKHSKVLSAGDLHWTRTQWTDRMTAGNATPKQAAICWDQAKDMAGNVYKKVVWKEVEYIITQAPVALLEEKRVDRVSSTDPVARRPSARALADEFGSPDLGFTTSRDGRAQLRRSNAFDFGHEDLAVDDDDDDNGGGGGSFSFGGVGGFGGAHPVADPGGADPGERSVPRPSSFLGLGDGVGGGVDGPGRDVRREVRPAATPRAGKSVKGGFTPPPCKKLKTMPQLWDEIARASSGLVVERDCEVWNCGYYIREFLAKLTKRDWMFLFCAFYFYF